MATNTLSAEPRATRPAQLHRIQDVDSLGAKKVLELAFHALEPAERTQRQAISALMPELYMLRNKGFTFQQITSLLGQCGFRLQPSTVRIYFNEMLVDRQDECIRRMNDQMIILAEIKKETEGVEFSMIAGKASAIIEMQRGRADSKVDEVFNVNNLNKRIDPPAQSTPAPERLAAQAPPQKNGAAPRPTPTAAANAAADDVGFGLAAPTDTQPTLANINSNKNSFFDIPEDPVIPNLTSETTDAKQNINAIEHDLYCMPLQQNVKPLPRRTDVPEIIYSDILLEHPSIPGLMLSLDARLYGGLLEFKENNQIRTETVHEKVFRIRWKTPISMTETVTGKNFVVMDNSLFKNIK